MPEKDIVTTVVENINFGGLVKGTKMTGEIVMGGALLLGGLAKSMVGVESEIVNSNIR